MINQEKILEEIKAEREYQDYKWGGPRHDDGHSANDWIAYITSYLGKNEMSYNNLDFRNDMIKVAALAVAAVEWYDRGK